MKELMIHVERIVRPVRARQSRKLRMRNELLGHLQTALDEECGRTADEAAAIEQAEKRLGDPAELTRELQRSVPMIERVLLAKAPERFNSWERRAAKHMGLYNPATFAHWLLLYGTGAIAWVMVCAFSPRVRPDMVSKFFVGEIDHPGRAKTVLIVICLLQWTWALIGVRFLALAAVPAKMFRLSRVIESALVMLLAQGLSLILIITQMALRSPTIGEMTESLGVAVLLAGPCILVGRRVAALRRPYDKWLTLDIFQ